MINDNYKVRFNYLAHLTNTEVKLDWIYVTAHSINEAMLIALNRNKVSLGQVLNIEVSRI